MLRPTDAGVSYPGRSWTCKTCPLTYARKPKRPKLALVAEMLLGTARAAGSP